MADLMGCSTHNPPVKRLRISEPLNTLPPFVFDLADSLEHLDLSGTGLASLPDNFGQLKKLKVAFFSNCHFITFPKQLAACPELEMVAFRSNGMREIPEEALPPRLRWLILTDNQLEVLPRSIGNCPRPQKCMLSGNRLRTLPMEMAACQKLGLLRLSANHIDGLPNWLFEMPELSFLSFAGNPCSSAILGRGADVSSPELTAVSWSDIEVQDLVGEGASGIILKGLWKAVDMPREVAVKLFKGDVTSDGTPLDEMRACIVAGSHSNLINPLGEIQDHPDKKGLLMELVPPIYSTLGLPPSLQTCTRDCFLPTAKLTLAQALSILRGIASAAAHLHAHHVSHGDMYAHNILYNPEGHALLGDFGAASIYTDESIEQLEVLAFAHLIEDTWGLVKVNFNHAELSCSSKLKLLHERCASPRVGSRPRFADIEQDLNHLAGISRAHNPAATPPAARFSNTAA